LTVAQHGVPRVSGVVDKSEAAREKERKQIEQYRSLESEVAEKVCRRSYITPSPGLRRG
jgi:geranylgeranyl transferase type-2 subunit alpha